MKGNLHKAKRPAAKRMLFTIGHSTQTLENFARVLRAYGIKRVIDIRSIPRSRHNPQFNREALAKFLRSRKINYRHMKELGGLRHARADSTNTGWINASFRGFADYMQMDKFADAIARLIELSAAKPTAIMCAETVPWRCHRSLIADALAVRHVEVWHIFSATSSKPHQLTGFAKIHRGKISYPGQSAGAR